MAASPANLWRYGAGLVAGFGLVTAGGALVLANHSANNAGLRDNFRENRAPPQGALLSAAAFRVLGHQIDPGALGLAQRYDPLARLARTGLPDAAAAILATPESAPPVLTFEDLTPQQAVVTNASIPFSPLPNPPARPFRIPADAVNDRARALTCLTMAVYYEAASESDEGQAAVAQVVLNRVRHPLFPKSVCGVVFQGSSLPTGCQFTFTCDGSLARRPSEAGWSRARRIAEQALAGHVAKRVGEATHYHTQWVVPYWQPTLDKITQIGAHIFYRWMGGSGSPGAFVGGYAGFEPPPPPIAGFDTGPTTVMLAQGGQPVRLAAVAEVTSTPQGRDAAAEVARAPLETSNLAPSLPAPEATPAAEGPPKKPSYFGDPFGRNGHARRMGGG